jgi:hypothetical protein
MIGFDLARTSNPAERLASANGIINQAGFSASLVLVVAIGLVPRLAHAGGRQRATTPVRSAGRCAPQYPLWALGLLQGLALPAVRTRAVVNRAELTASARAEG